MLKTVRDACTLQPNALKISVSDAIEQLDELINEAQDGDAYFQRTYITGGMETLLREGIARLAGKSSQAIFHLKQAMGGGKTHLLVGLGLMAKHPALRQKHAAGMSHIDAFGAAKVAAFNGRNSPNEFFWGFIASQLGKSDQFRKYWQNGPDAPDERAWIELFAGNEPILILLDEMPPYFDHLNARTAGAGTQADIALRAFANLLTAAAKKSNVCVVVSDLAASYQTGGKLVNQALQNARNEIGRQERSITPVDLAGDEIYAILRKRLFAQLPAQSDIQEVAAAFGQALTEAAKAKSVARSAEHIADEVEKTYPFHPRLKNLVALFKENENFKQTRGLMELVSRLLRSVWESKTNDVYLIGPQHFDLSISDVRDKLSEISDMRDVIARDIWDSNGSAHAQTIDVNTNSNAATQVASLLLTASMSTATNAVKGLTQSEIIEALVIPGRKPSEFSEALDSLVAVAWYIHGTQDGRIHFDRQENLTKLLKSLADDAPEVKITDLIKRRLVELFKPIRKAAYVDVIPLPTPEEISDRVSKQRVLVIQSPESKLPQDAILKIFDDLTEKNNLLVLTGGQTSMGSIETAARHVYAAQRAETKIPDGHPQRAELDTKTERYEYDFESSILSIFATLLFPIQLSGRPAKIASKPLDTSRNHKEPYNGEAQVEKSLTADPIKLVTDIEGKADMLREKAESLLWPANNVEARWKDVEDRAEEQCGFPWLHGRGLDELKSLAFNRGWWEDLGNGYVTRSPAKKRTKVQVTPADDPDDEGNTTLRVSAINGGPRPEIRYAEDGIINDASPLLKGDTLSTKALRVTFLVKDTTGKYETGDPYVWKNSLILRNNFDKAKRTVELLVAPRGTIRYTLDGTNPKEGQEYTGPIKLPDGAATMLVYGVCEDLSADVTKFTFPAKGKDEVQVDNAKPASISSSASKSLDSGEKVHNGLAYAVQHQVEFEEGVITIGEGGTVISISIGRIRLDGATLLAMLKAAQSKFEPGAPVVMKFKKAHFPTGHNLKEFSEEFGITLSPGEVQT